MKILDSVYEKCAFHHEMLDFNYDLYYDIENISDTEILSKKLFILDKYKYTSKIWKQHTFRLWCSRWSEKDDEPEFPTVCIDHLYKNKIIESLNFGIDRSEGDIDQRYKIIIMDERENNKTLRVMMRITPACWTYKSAIMDWSWLVKEIHAVSKEIDQILREW